MSSPPPSPIDEAFAGPGLRCWVLEIARAEVMWLRYVLEASEGVGFLSGGKDGVVRLIAPDTQADTVEAILRDLATEDTDLRVLRRPTQAAE